MTKKKVAILLVFIIPLSIITAVIARERHSVLKFYDIQAERRCDRENAMPSDSGIDLQRHAVANAYLSGLMDTTGDSHVSKKVQFHRLLADFAIANLLSDAEVETLFAKTPCSFRRR